MHLLHPAPTFAVIAVRAGCHNIRPDVLAAHMARRHMVYGQVAIALSTILTCIIIAAKHFSPRQLDVGARPMNLALQPDD